jgi:four helix bundle protein
MGRPHYRLDAWKVAMEIVKDVYVLSRRFPKDEVYGLTSQIRRSAVSIPSNIAEGAGRNGTKEFAQFLGVAMGSLSELDTQLLIAVDLGYVEEGHPIFDKAEQLSSLIAGLQKSLTRPR